MVEQVKVRWSGDPTLGSTWEDKTALQARFPTAEAWGQASSQGEGDVSAADMPGPPDGNTGPGTGRPQRTLKPNPRTAGPEWTK